MRLSPRGAVPVTRWSFPFRSSPVAVAGSLVLACLVVACGNQTLGGSGTASPPAVSASGVTVSPAAVASPPLAAAEPPAAALAAEGGDPVTGQLGSFTWADGGSDSPWLPGTPVVVGAGEPLTVTLADGVAVADWSARRVPAGTTDGAGAVGLGSGPTPVTFAAPRPGSWSVQVTVTFAGGLGSAAYYWQLTVR
jgi:hypothetical protein